MKMLSPGSKTKLLAIVALTASLYIGDSQVNATQLSHRSISDS